MPDESHVGSFGKADLKCHAEAGGDAVAHLVQATSRLGGEPETTRWSEPVVGHESSALSQTVEDHPAVSFDITRQGSRGEYVRIDAPEKVLVGEYNALQRTFSDRPSVGVGAADGHDFMPRT